MTLAQNSDREDERVEFRQYNQCLADFVAKCSPAMKAQFFIFMREFQKERHKTSPRIAKNIGDGIWELRPKAGAERATLFFTFANNKATFLLSFYKKKGQDPTARFKQRAVKIAEKIAREDETTKWTPQSKPDTSPVLN